MLILNELSIAVDTIRDDLVRIFTALRFSHCNTQDKLVIEDSNGGYANKNVIVHDSDEPGKRYFIRLFNPKLEYYLRDSQRNYRFYNDHGLSVRMHCMFRNGCVMDVVDGRPITLATTHRLYEPAVRRAVAEEVARYHQEKFLTEARKAGFENGIGWHDPQWFKPLFRGLPQEMDDLPTADDVIAEFDRLDRNLNERRAPIVFCHGDLNPSNIVYNDSKEKATFVDYDSPSITHAVFDIAGHFFAFHDVFNARRTRVDLEYRREWVRIYLTKKNELNGIHTFAPISEQEIDAFMEDLEIAHLKVQLHFMSCFAGLLTDMADPNKPLDPDWLIKVVREHWIVYHEEKEALLKSGLLK